MRTLGIALAILLSWAANAVCDESAADAGALRERLLAGRQPVGLETIKAQRGCGPGGCSVDFDGLSVMREQASLRTADGQAIETQQHAPPGMPVLPELDADPLGAFRVSRNGHLWGTCLEFTHTSLGKSGAAQRWTSIVLVPEGALVAHRFIGYWAGCDSLAQGEKPGEVILPVVEPAAERASALHLVAYHCDATRCDRVVDPHVTAVVADHETGALRIERR